MKRIFLFLFFSRQLFAAFEFSWIDVSLNGLSGSVVATDQVNSAFLLNPAISSALESHYFGLQYSRPYGMAEISYATLAGNVITPYACMGLGLSTLGTDIYQENQLVFNLSRAWFNRTFFTGLNFHWYTIHVEEYELVHALGVDVGLQYRIHPDFLVGFSLLNLNRPAIHRHREEIPLVTSWGMQFRLSDQFTSYLCVQKDSWFPATVRFGFNFLVNSYFAVQTGMSSYPATPSLGLRFTPKWVSVHYSVQYHFDLGLTHFWGLSLSKKAEHE